MAFNNDTIFITGGGSGIGRGLAEALHARGNKVIISGRRRDRLQAVVDANDGMSAIELDIADPASITHVVEQLKREHPELNVLLNNAGVMSADDVATAADDDLIVNTVTTNLLGPIRLTGALVDQLRGRAGATVVNVTSGLGFVPLAMAATYSATKAALHSYTLSQRYLLAALGIRVVEVAPPWVRTELFNSQEEPRAMPLDEFIAGAVEQLVAGNDEVLVGPATALRANAGPDEYAFVKQFNDMLSAGPAAAD